MSLTQLTHGQVIWSFNKYCSVVQVDIGGRGTPFIAFSPRKAKFSLYVTSTNAGYSHLLDKLGKFKMSKACIYFKKLDDLDLGVLEEVCRVTMKHVEERYGGC